MRNGTRPDGQACRPVPASRHSLLGVLLSIAATTVVLAACGGHDNGRTVAVLPNGSQPENALPVIEQPSPNPPPMLNDCLALDPGTAFITSNGFRHEIRIEDFHGQPALAEITSTAEGLRENAAYFQLGSQGLITLGSIDYDEAGNVLEETTDTGSRGFPASLMPGQSVAQTYEETITETRPDGAIISTSTQPLSGSVYFEGFVDLDIGTLRFANACKLVVMPDSRINARSVIWLARGYGVIRIDDYDQNGELDAEDSSVLTQVVSRP
ncbi:MAG: hypothetical protein ACRYGK_15890 [Janthinobacterium lividum]